MQYRNAFLDPPLIPGYYQCRFRSCNLDDSTLCPVVLMCWRGFTLMPATERKTKRTIKCSYRQWDNIIWSKDKGTDGDFGIVFDFNPDNTRELFWLDDADMPPIVENDMMWGILYKGIQNYITEARWPTWEEIAVDPKLWGIPIFTMYQNQAEALAAGDTKPRLWDDELIQHLGYQSVSAVKGRLLPGYEFNRNKNTTIPKLLALAGVTKV